MESPRDRRLRSDFRALTQLKAESTIVDFKAYGNPPERYLVAIRGGGLRRSDPGTGTIRAEVIHHHEVEIYLGADYPRNRPQLQWKTEIFHPNISGTGLVCLGGYSTHWVPSLNLDELVEMLWDMVRFANYDVKSPYNLVAARWVAGQSEFRFPLDVRAIRDKGPAPEAVAPAPAAKPSAPPTPSAPPAPVRPAGREAVVPARGDVVRTQPAPAASGDIVFLDEGPATPKPPPRKSGDDDILIIR